MKIRALAGILCAALLSVSFTSLLRERAKVSVLTEYADETAKFREMDFPAGLYQELREKTSSDEASMELLTDSMLLGDFHPRVLQDDPGLFEKYKSQEYEQLLGSYQAVWQDVQVFPLLGEGFSFSDSWMEARTYGGERKHEGTDIFGQRKEAGYYPVVSMTDGVVEEVGWLTLGGYRIGVRSPHGGYYYYAHLDSYDREFQRGDSVCAGELLGFMGNTGYGTEGTRDQFPVHLHVGIYISTERCRELSVNPFQILQALQLAEE